MDVNDVSHLLGYAKACLRQGDRLAAKSAARHIIRLDPSAYQAWLILAGLSNPQQREAYYEKARALAPDDPFVTAAGAWVEKTRSYTASKKARKANQLKRSSGALRAAAAVLFLILAAGLVLVGVNYRDVFFSAQSNHAAHVVMGFKPTLTPAPTMTSTTQPTALLTLAAQPSALPSSEPQLAEPTQALTPTARLTAAPTATLTVVPELLGCEMTLQFASGPLAGEEISFAVLDESYFGDKGDKFDLGKNTGVFYMESNLLVLHSGYKTLGITSLEAEPIRFYLEGWGNKGPEAIEEKMAEMLGSTLVWACEGQAPFASELTAIARLSHQASQDLWLRPWALGEILEQHEGEAAEWVGGYDQIRPNAVHLSFCGWGPSSLKAERYTYFRYVLGFEIQN